MKRSGVQQLLQTCYGRYGSEGMHCILKPKDWEPRNACRMAIEGTWAYINAIVLPQSPIVARQGSGVKDRWCRPVPVVVTINFEGATDKVRTWKEWGCGIGSKRLEW